MLFCKLVCFVLLQALYEFDLVVNIESSFDVFEEAWGRFQCAILKYAEDSLSMPQMLKHALRDNALSATDEGIYPYCYD